MINSTHMKMLVSKLEYAKSQVDCLETEIANLKIHQEAYIRDKLSYLISPNPKQPDENTK